MLRLLLLRHAKAQDASPSGRDADRPLSPRGERQAAWLAERLKGDAQLRPAAVLSSPAVRCQQTAEAIATACGLETDTEPVLALDSSAGDIVSRIETQLFSEYAQPLLLVSHQPHLGPVVAALIAGPTASPPRVQTGECFVLERTLDDARWKMAGALRLDDD